MVVVILIRSRFLHLLRKIKDVIYLAFINEIFNIFRVNSEIIEGVKLTYIMILLIVEVKEV